MGKRTVSRARDTPRAMAQENVELVRRALDGFLSADYDFRNVEGFFEVADPGIAFDISRTNPDAQVYRGRDGIIDALDQWIGTWDAYEAEVLELIDMAPDGVVTVIRERSRLKGSDAWVEHTRGAVWTIKDQRITRYEEHPDRAMALEAAALKQ
jgi:ketosteroid isomerase-like protein